MNEAEMALREALSTERHRLVRAAPRGLACVCGQYAGAESGTEPAEAWREHLIQAAVAAAVRAPGDLTALLDAIRDEVLEAILEGDAQDCSSADCIADAVYEIVRVRLAALTAEVAS